MHKHERGFTAVEVIIVVGVLSLLGAGGWFVWEKQQNKPANIPAQTQQETQKTAEPKQEKKKATIPADYQVYEDNNVGFSIAFPKYWGTLAAPEVKGASTVRSTPKIDMRILGDSSEATLEGVFTLTNAPKDGFEIGTGKYGAELWAIAEEGKYVWRVISANPAFETSKVGENYTPQTLENTLGVKMYDFTSGDEGSLGVRWVIETDANYILIEFPYLHSPDTYRGGPDGKADQAAYKTLWQTINNTIQLQ